MLSNIERTGDRDLEWSRICRKPDGEYLRSCDLDVTHWCKLCGLPLWLNEVTRDPGYKATTYVQNMATRLGISAYLVRHGAGKIQVTHLPNGQPVEFSESEYHARVKEKYLEHLKQHQSGSVS